MKTLILLLALFITGCSSFSNTAISDKQFIATYSNRQIGSNSGDVVKGLIEISKKQCGSKNMNIVSLYNSPRGPGTLPEGTLIYECN